MKLSSRVKENSPGVYHRTENEEYFFKKKNIAVQSFPVIKGKMNKSTKRNDLIKI